MLCKCTPSAGPRSSSASSMADRAGSLTPGLRGLHRDALDGRAGLLDYRCVLYSAVTSPGLLQ